VREIVMAHYGTIDVQSASGQGTTFTVMLPLVSMEGMRQA
jgi:signal transduction histidine kinase